MAIVQPIDYTSGNGFAQGLQLKGLQDEVQQRAMANEQAQIAAERQKSAYAALQNARPEDLPSLRRQYPEFADLIQKEIGIQDAEHATFVNKALNKISVAVASGNPAMVKTAIEQNKPALMSFGVDPQEAIQMAQNDPQQFGSLLKASMYATMPIEKQVDAQQKQQQLDETARSNRAGEALQARGQDITIRGQNISAQNAALSREIQRAEVQDKVLDRQIARETNQIKLEELRQKQLDVRSKADAARADRQAAAQGAVDTFSTALDSLSEIEHSPGLKKAVGFNSAFPTVPGTDAANFEARLDTFKAQTFLPMVASLKGMGALSDAEGKKLSDAVGALSPKMSEDAFRSSIGKIRTQLESKLGTVKRQFDYQEPAAPQQSQQAQQTQQPQQAAPAQAAGGYSSLWGD
ncbi:phage DNA ejection protein [Escherichia coli]|uniref:phage DNA ejection protein n=1 Tax=Escherichia coli TaxID=562 RepID=UPI000AD29970|nr:phage DNA ejection protein [Escherichia coli]